jgi:TM2 domain-containing membrane protein YozV
MPRHVTVSPEEDVAAFYGGHDPAVMGPKVAPEPGAPEVGTPPVTPGWPDSVPEVPATGLKPLKPVIRPMPPSLTQPEIVADAPNATVAALLSLLVPGLGQLYLGQGQKGTVLVIAGLITGCGLGSFGILNLICGIDAWFLAERKRKGETLGPWQFF